MSLPQDLLVQARMLATIDPCRPKQANLRRAISGAYYALFHLLATDAARLYVRDHSGLVTRITRTINHADIMSVSREFNKRVLPRSFQHVERPLVISDMLVKVTKAFISLQAERHKADYDMGITYTREATLTHVEQAETAFAEWAVVKSADDARLYHACFSNWDSWNKPPR